MSVMRVKIQKDFTVLYNGVLENPNLSFKAKGLWAYCMSRPDDWEFHVSHLATISKEGEDAIYSALKELIREGLVERTQTHEGGRFGSVDYIIYPYPQELKECLPRRDFQHAEKQRPENPALPSTDKKPSTEKEESVCYSPPVGANPEKKEYEIVKKDPKGKELKISLNDVFLHSLRNKLDWDTKEIENAFNILGEYPTPVYDLMAFIEGTIKNIRNQKRSEYLKKNGKKCQNQDLMTYDDSKPRLSVEDMKGLPSLASLLGMKSILQES
jgi:hypothetical protein